MAPTSGRGSRGGGSWRPSTPSSTGSANPIWIGATLALLTIATVNEFFFSIGDNSWLFNLVGLAYVWFSVYFASLVAIFPGFLDGQLLNDAGLPEDVSRAKYTAIAGVAIGIATLAGFVFYWLGASTRSDMVNVPLEGNEELAAQAGLPSA